MKRLFDLSSTILGLVLLAPVLLVVSLLIKLDDRGPVFFRQTRVGRGGRAFRVWKFRTMVPDAERRGGALTVGDDPRTTRVGRWLRHSKVDELPQLFNVLAGDMSLVGPRPEVPRYVARYSSDERRVLELKPGITDPASIVYSRESELLAGAPDPERYYTTVVMPDKIRINMTYAARASRWTDLKVVLATLRHLLPGYSRHNFS